MRVVGLDLSLTGAGLCRIDWHPSDPVNVLSRVEWQVYGTEAADFPRSLAGRALRLRTMAGHIYQWTTSASVRIPDLVCVEAPSYGSEGAGTHERAGLWWLIVARLTALGIPVAEVSPSTVKCYAQGKGSGKGVTKDATFAATVRRYVDHASTLADNNAADALLLADIGARYLGRPLTDLPQTHTRALAAIRWPSTITTGA